MNCRRHFEYLLKNKCISWISFLFLFIVLKGYIEIYPLIPRYYRIHNVVKSVEKYSKMLSFESIVENSEFVHFSGRIKNIRSPPYVVFFDMSNLDLTVSHLCNLRYFNGTLERIVAVSFEKEAEKKLNAIAPFIPTVTVDFTKAKNELPKNMENKTYVTYQLILLLRARIVAALSSLGVDFWAMQQDSIWTSNFGDLKVEAHYPDANMIFDTVGNDQLRVYDLMKGWICGSTFFVRSSPLTAEFFKKVADMMTRRLSADSSIMTYLCGVEHYKCAKLPKSVISSGDYFHGNRNFTPVLIQVDLESNLSKTELLVKNKLYFRRMDGTCDFEAVRNVKKAVVEAIPKMIKEADDIPMWLLYYQSLKEFIGFDPYRHKVFLTVQKRL